MSHYLKILLTISNSIFDDCTLLPNITIPDGVTSIGEYAFYKCNSLNSITIPNSVTTIGAGAFDSSWLTSITFNGHIPTIGNTAFNVKNGSYSIKVYHHSWSEVDRNKIKSKSDKPIYFVNLDLSNKKPVELWIILVSIFGGITLISISIYFIIKRRKHKLI